MPASASAEGGLSLAGAGTTAKVRYGERLELSGRVGAVGPVRLEYAARGGAWRSLRETLAAANGSYRFRLRPRSSGAFRAVSAEGASSARTVTVVARLGGRARRHVNVGHRVLVRGRLAPGFGGRRVRLQLAAGRGWRTVDRTLTGRGGRYHASWRASGAGRYRLRVKFAGDGRNGAVSRTLRGRVYVYRPSAASWYGPGFYGNRTACGDTLAYGTLGVAHKWLPCGTKVTVRYRGRSVTVPVIDRGPYSGDREWDLTGATKSRIGFGSTGTVWVAH
ncbi:MAG TPA: septal ring lytic transglycosylase RlpA family protein [Thermoleophilaceae bacterium]|nr:septal ring lytic transglycosylase RlpA family protein [Thermoleophilaceae bacterium]